VKFPSEVKMTYREKQFRIENHPDSPFHVSIVAEVALDNYDSGVNHNG
jgi:hypothetical protein